MSKAFICVIGLFVVALASTAAWSAIPFPDIHPVAFAIGPISVRWYALAYVAGIMLGWYYLGWLNRNGPEALTAKAYDSIMVWAILGIMLGGRLGYVIFYNAGYFIHHPEEILAVWQGGMSFHGGFLGLVLALFLFCKAHGLRWMRLMDLIAATAPIGLFLGRLANFVNAELVGRVASPDISWAVIFPQDPFPRHPSQLYQAGMEGLVLFALLFYVARYTRARLYNGVLSGLFLVFYGFFRIIAECFREPDAQLGFIMGAVTMGQILSLPMIILGMYLIFTAKLDRYGPGNS